MTERLMFNSNQLINGQQTKLTANILPEAASGSCIDGNSQQLLNINQSQESIYEFLMQTVKKLPPEAALKEFKQLFIEHDNAVVSDAVAAVYEIIIAGDELKFHNTIKRCCYIVINNWNISRSPQYIPKLIESLTSSTVKQHSLSPTVNRLRIWVDNFVNSSDYQELKLFAAKHSNKSPLSSRYSSHLLVAQSANPKNPVEQRAAAHSQAQQLRYRYKFDLAMYIAGFQNGAANKQSINPTGLKDEVLRLIRTIVAKRHPSSYATIASVFLDENKNISYKDFKKSLQRYLINSVDNKEIVGILKQKLSTGLESLDVRYHEKALTEELLLKTCNKVIKYLLTEKSSEPSQLFTLLISHGHYLTLVILLLKIVLLCKSTRTHLETYIAELIKYYENHPGESESLVNFLEIYNLMFAIYADNMQIRLD